MAASEDEGIGMGWSLLISDPERTSGCLAAAPPPAPRPSAAQASRCFLPMASERPTRPSAGTRHFGGLTCHLLSHSPLLSSLLLSDSPSHQRVVCSIQKALAEAMEADSAHKAAEAEARAASAEAAEEERAEILAAQQVALTEAEAVLSAAMQQVREGGLQGGSKASACWLPLLTAGCWLPLLLLLTVPPHLTLPGARATREGVRSDA